MSKKKNIVVTPWNPSGEVPSPNAVPGDVTNNASQSTGARGTGVSGASGAPGAPKRVSTPTPGAPTPSAGPGVKITKAQKDEQQFNQAAGDYKRAYTNWNKSLGGGYTRSQIEAAHNELLDAKEHFNWAHQHYANILGRDPIAPSTTTGATNNTGTGGVTGGTSTNDVNAGPKPSVAQLDQAKMLKNSGFSGTGATGGASNATGGTGGTPKATGGGTGSGGGSSPSSYNATPDVVKSRDDWAESYGTQAALVDSVPKLKTLFNQAVAGGWTNAKFQKLFANTDWYLNHSDVWRTAYATKKTDPASWDNELNKATTRIKALAVSTGIKLSDTQIASLANQSLFLSGGSASNIDETVLKTHVVGTGVITGKGGESLNLMNTLKQHGADMGIAHNDAWYVSAAQNVLHGDSTIDGAKQQITNVAKSKYASFADQLDAGFTVRQVASPYMTSMANLLELDQNALSLSDPTINKALTSLDKDSKPALTPLWQFETGLRKDPRWASTKNARSTVDTVTRKILSDFGLVS